MSIPIAQIAGNGISITICADGSLYIDGDMATNEQPRVFFEALRNACAAAVDAMPDETILTIKVPTCRVSRFKSSFALGAVGAEIIDETPAS